MKRTITPQEVSSVAGAEWARWTFAGLFALLTVFYLFRLFASGPDAPERGGHDDRTVDLSRGVMSLGMVAMLVPWLDPLPRLGWQVLFGLAAGYIAMRLIRRRALSGHHELHLVVGGLAMVYMFAAMPTGHHMAGGMDMAATSSALPALTWVLVAYFLVFVVRLSARLAVPVNALVSAPTVASPHLLGSSEVVMGIGMSYMLLTMR